METDIVGLRSPWIIYHEKLKALFGEDRDVTVEFGDDTIKKYTLRVANPRKADALSRLMPSELTFGNVCAVQTVVPANTAGAEPLPTDASAADVVAAAFDGNPVVTQVRQVSKGLFRELAYCVFRREVVQYQVDNMADINGNASTLMESVARDVMTTPVADKVFFCTSACTALGSSVDAPLGEWP